MHGRTTTINEPETLSAILGELRTVSKTLEKISALLSDFMSSGSSENLLNKAGVDRFIPDHFSIMNLRPALKETWKALEKCGGEATSREVAKKLEKKRTADDSSYKLTNKYLNELQEIGLVTKRREKVGSRYSIIFKAVILAGEYQPF